jgi:hypothetical protein
VGYLDYIPDSTHMQTFFKRLISMDLLKLLQLNHVESIPQGKIHITWQRKERTPVNCSYDFITTAERQTHVGQDKSMWRKYTHLPA